MAEITVDALDIRHDTSEEKIYFSMKGQEEAYLSYTLHTKDNPNVVEFDEMHIPDTLEGVGLDDAMALEGIRFVEKNGYKIKATSPYISGYLNRHPEFWYLRIGGKKKKNK